MPPQMLKMKNHRKMRMEVMPAEWAVMPFIFIQMVSLSTLYYIVPQLVLFKVCYRTFNRTICSHLGQRKFRVEETRVFDEAAAWNAVIHFASLCPALVITLPLGAFADLISKKKMLLVPAIANIASCLINLCCSIFMNAHVGFLAVSSFITSIYGELYGCIMLCCVYSSSATSAGDRTTVLTIVFFSSGFGFGIGSLVGNYLLRYYGYEGAFLFVGVGLIIGLFYAIVLIPPVDDIKEKSVDREASDVWSGYMRHMRETWAHLMSFLRRRVLNSKDKTILLLFIAAFFPMASYGGERALLPLFLKQSPLSLTADKIGIFLALNECSRAVGLIVLVPILEKYLGSSDYPLMIIGPLHLFISLAILSFSRTTLVAYISLIFAIPSLFHSPSIRSQLTKLVSNEEYGVALSVVGLVGNIGMLIMAVGSNGLFVATVEIYTGFSILLMASTNLMSVGILLYIVCTKERDESRHDDYNEVSANENENKNAKH